MSQITELTSQGVAIETVLWAAQRGIRAPELLRGLDLYWDGPNPPDWHDAVLTISIAWSRLQAPQATPNLRLVA